MKNLKLAETIKNLENLKLRGAQKMLSQLTEPE